MKRWNKRTTQRTFYSNIHNYYKKLKYHSVKIYKIPIGILKNICLILKGVINSNPCVASLWIA